MAEPDHKWRKGDTVKQYFTLKSAGTAVDLTAATAVTYYTRLVGASANTIDGVACTIETAASGYCSFTPPGTSPAGWYYEYQLVAWGDGTQSRFPTDGDGDDYYGTLQITPNLE